jgi:hypothetical protein
MVAAPRAKGKRRKGLMVTGLIVLLVGVLGGGAVIAKGMANYEEAVKSLARAPVGCTTTLVFDKAASFTVYIETKGKLGELNGDCDAKTTEYDHAGDKLPKVSLKLVNSAGDEVQMPEATGASYDVGGYVGTQTRSVEVFGPGTYRLDVASDEDDFAISIGKKPKDDNDLMMIIGGGIALAGLIVGLLLMLLGLRRRNPAPVIADGRNPMGPLPEWAPAPYAATMPPAPPIMPVATPQPPPPPPTTAFPGQPPIRLADRPTSGGFAPPAFAPPSLPTPSGPPVAPIPAPDDEDEPSQWTIQDKPSDKGWS